MLPVWC